MFLVTLVLSPFRPTCLSTFYTAQRTGAGPSSFLPPDLFPIAVSTFTMRVFDGGYECVLECAK